MAKLSAIGTIKGHRHLLIIVGDRKEICLARLGEVLPPNRARSVLWCGDKSKGKLKSYLHVWGEWSAKPTHREVAMPTVLTIIDVSAASRALQDSSKWLDLNSVEVCAYRCLNRILGRSFDVCIFDDLRHLTPNVFCQAAETVRRDGLILIFTSDGSSTLTQHRKYANSLGLEVQALLIPRLIKLLPLCSTAVVVRDDLSLIRLSTSVCLASLPSATGQKQLDSPSSSRTKPDKTSSFENSVKPLAAENEAAAREAQLSICAGKIASMDRREQALRFCATEDQRRVLKRLLDLSDGVRLTVALTAARGRGKSSTLGLFLACLAERDCLVSAPSRENVDTLFEYYRRGNGTGQARFVEARKLIDELARPPSVLVVDEAAGVPLTVLKAALQCDSIKLVVFASTVSGYEGMGRSFSIKLLQSLEASSAVTHRAAEGVPKKRHRGELRKFHHLEMFEPIRYCLNDPIEQFINVAFCLDAGEQPCSDICLDSLKIVRFNKSRLFDPSFPHAECQLTALVAVFVSSHYKNSPNDLMLLADSPTHEVFALIGSDKKSLSDHVLSACLCAWEGGMPKETAAEGLQRGPGGAGDMLAWKMAEIYRDPSLASLVGLRVVRVATHNEHMRKGYAKRLLQAVADWSGRASASIEDNDKLSTELHCSAAPRVADWMGTAFGLTADLHAFWTSCNYKLISVAANATEATGEPTCLMMSFKQTPKEYLFADFRSRFVGLLPYPFRAMDIVLAGAILRACPFEAARPQQTFSISDLDLQRLSAYADKQCDRGVCRHLWSQIAQAYFTCRLPKVPDGSRVQLSPLQEILLLAMGLQGRTGKCTTQRSSNRI